MFGFFRDREALVCDGVPLEQLAHTHGTPLYVYSAESIRCAYRSLDEAFTAHPHRINYSIKAYSSLGLFYLLNSLCSSSDGNSAGEIELALLAGCPADKIMFTGVGKT